MKELFSRKNLEEVLQKIDTEAQNQSSQSRLADRDDELLLKHHYEGVKVGLSMAGKWIEDLMREKI